jgi:hypothetical protein
MSLKPSMCQDMQVIFLKFQVKIYLVRAMPKLLQMLSTVTTKEASITPLNRDLRLNLKLNLIKAILEHSRMKLNQQKLRILMIAIISMMPSKLLFFSFKFFLNNFFSINRF